MPDLSVVISRFGADSDAAVESVIVAAARAESDVELVVVSQSHPAGPPVVAGRVVEVFPLGAAYARNRGLALASAPVVAFVDGNLTVGPDWAEAIFEAFEREPTADAVVGPVSNREFHDAGPRLCGRLRLELLPPPWAIDGVSNAAFRRSKLIDLCGFEHVLSDHLAPGAADAELFIRLARQGGRIAWVPSMSASRATASGPPPIDRAREVVRTALRRRYPALVLRYAAGAARRGGPLRTVRELVAAARQPDQTVARSLLEQMPANLRKQLSAMPEPFARSHRAKTHFIYRAGEGQVLHLYANPSERLRRSLAEREAIRIRSAVEGIPRLDAVVETIDAVWVLEELVRGRVPDIAAPAQWFAAVADWAVGMAGPPGRLLGEVPTWGQHCSELLGHTPPELRGRVRSALEAVTRLPAVHMHGDLQRRNVLMDGERIGAVDWEGAWLEGLPGLDLVFLALFAASDTPDETILVRLAQGQDAPWDGLREALGRLGVDDSKVPAALVVMLASWALSEDRRLARLGAPPGAPVFRPMFHRLAA